MLVKPLIEYQNHLLPHCHLDRVDCKERAERSRLRPRTSSFARNDTGVLVKPLIEYQNHLLPHCHLDRVDYKERAEISRLRPHSSSFAGNDIEVVCEAKIDV